MADSDKGIAPVDNEVQNDGPTNYTEVPIERKITWYRSTYFNALILGLCNFLAPGIWGAMNSLGGGGEEKPYLVNVANGSSFSLMVVSCFLSSVVVRYIGIKWTLILGSAGYCPYAAGLYVNNRYGADWLIILGAVFCGIGAGLFWMAEATIALSYPEPYNQGRFLGFWLGFRVGGQILGGAISLGINAHRATAGAVSYAVYEVFIALQALGPFVGLLLSSPKHVQRKDGVRVQLKVTESIRRELLNMVKLWISKKFILIVPFICQAVYSEAVMFSYEGLWFSVRARALGSFISGVLGVIAGNTLGLFLDSKRISLRTRSRGAFFIAVGWQAMCWIWGTVVTTEFNKSEPVYDWTDPGFGRAFVPFLFWVIGFQLNYMYLYFLTGNLADSEEEVIRISGLLRGTESAAQAVSYGLSSIPIMAAVGSVYLNFALWAVAVVPAWVVVRRIGVEIGDKKIEREARLEHEAVETN